MDALRASALELLTTVNPDDLTIREIAEHADVFHRYIPDYFGGKAELLADIYPAVVEQATLSLTPFSDSTIRPEVIRTARLAIWLSANRDEGLPRIERSLITTLIATLTSRAGLEEPTATLMAQRMMAGVIVLAVFPDVVSDGPIDISAHRELERRIISLLAADSANNIG
jgi:AcrR family transcriptional regulator